MLHVQSFILTDLFLVFLNKVQEKWYHSVSAVHCSLYIVSSHLSDSVHNLIFFQMLHKHILWYCHNATKSS